MGKVLIVEDDEAMSYVFSNHVTVLGHAVDIARNGKEAVTKCDEVAYDLVLMDIHMPVMNGLEATRLILESRPDLNIIAITSSNDRLECERIKILGAKGCLVKPVTQQTLQKVVESYFRVL